MITLAFGLASQAQAKNQNQKPNRTRLCGPCIAAIVGDKVRFGPIR